MDLNDLLADIEGIGEDSFVRSALPKQAAHKPALAELPVTSERSQEPTLIAGTVAAPPLKPPAQLDLVLDVEMELTVELGRINLLLKDVMAIEDGDRLALNRGADAPLNIYVNDRLIARGEPLVVNGALAVKILELVPQDA